MNKYDAEKPNDKPEEKTFADLLELVRCVPDTKRENLTKDFWTSYEEVKQYKPKYKSGSSEVALENQSTSALKSLLREKRDDLSQDLVSFIDTLIKDIKKYKTLSKFTLRRLKLGSSKNKYDELTSNIIELQRKLGNDYLEVILERGKNIENDVIIAIGNKAN